MTSDRRKRTVMSKHNFFLLLKKRTYEHHSQYLCGWIQIRPNIKQSESSKSVIYLKGLVLQALLRAFLIGCDPIIIFWPFFGLFSSLQGVEVMSKSLWEKVRCSKASLSGSLKSKRPEAIECAKMHCKSSRLPSRPLANINKRS